MRNFFYDRLREIESITSEIETRIFLITQLRLLLQQVAYALLEWIMKDPSGKKLISRETIDNLLAPSDGTLASSIEELLLICEKVGWSGAYRKIISPIQGEQKIDLFQSNPTPISLIKKFIELRNDGAEGHGLPGGYNKTLEEKSYLEILKSLENFIPEIKGAHKNFGPEGRKIFIEFLRHDENNIHLIRKIKIINQETLRVSFQFINSNGEKSSYSTECRNFINLPNEFSLPKFSQENGFLYHGPERMEIFSGRTEEIDELYEWIDDDGSRACLVYGDGGMGKTSLVLELIHKIIEEEQPSEWKPKYVIFYTAKKTQWGLDGLKYIKAGEPQLLEVPQLVYTLHFGELPPESYFKKDLKAVCQSLQQKIAHDLDINKNEHLIIIDNAETLINSDEERASLAKEVREITRKLGRVIVTSRRREGFEANQIEIKPFREGETIDFIRRRAKKLDLTKKIEKLKDAEIISATEKFERRPLLLEVLLRAMTAPDCSSLEKAKNRVESMLRDDLGEFLFSDAWSRFPSETKKLLLLCTEISDVIDHNLLRICSEIVGISLSTAEKSLEESNGIASTHYIEGHISVTFSPNFIKFAEGKRKAQVKFIPTTEETKLARERYQQFLLAAAKYKGDRFQSAFRVPAAKAAYAERNNKRYGEANRLYQQALLSDPNNGWLHDRYAYFLFHDQRKHDAALIQSQKAVELLPNEGEAWYTRGMIESRLGLIRECEKSLDKAQSLGIDKVRCNIQKCWAYLKSKPQQVALARSELATLKLLTRSYLDNSREVNEIERIERRLELL